MVFLRLPEIESLLVVEETPYRLHRYKENVETVSWIFTPVTPLLQESVLRTSALYYLISNYTLIFYVYRDLSRLKSYPICPRRCFFVN